MLKSGSSFGKYILERELGSGPSGTVYLALDTRLDRQVAIKILRAELCRNATFYFRFKAQVRRIGSLLHPNVAMVYDLQEDDGCAVLISEYMESETLASLVRRRGLIPPDSALPLFRQISAALVGAHAQGVIHGGLKPSNVFIDSDGIVKVTDFGITSPECVDYGKDLEYLAPEILQGEAADEVADVYGLGFVCYYMLTASFPYPPANRDALLEQMRMTKIAKPRSLYPYIPALLEEVVLHALRIERKARFESIQAFLIAVDSGAASHESSAQDADVIAVSQSIAQESANESEATPFQEIQRDSSVTSKPREKRRLLYIAGSLILLCLVVIVVSHLWNEAQEKNSREELLHRQVALEAESRKEEERLSKEQWDRMAIVERAQSSRPKTVPSANPLPSDTQTTVATTAPSTTEQESDSRLLPVIVQNKVGFINTNGKLVLSPRYDAIKAIDTYEFHDGLARVKLNDKYGYIDEAGNVVITITYDGADPFSEGLACVKVGDRWGYIDKSGNTVISPQFPTAATFREGLFAFRDGQNTGYKDRTLRTVIPLQFSGGGPFYEGLASVMQGGKRGFIDRTGRFVIQPRYDEAYHFNEGLAPVKVEGLWGYIDHDGGMVIKPQFGQAYPFYEGLAVVRPDKDGSAGYIDKSGNLVIPARFSGLGPFAGDHAWACEENRCGYIDRSGRYIWRQE